MLKRVNKQGVKFLLFDDLNSEDGAMVQARLTRSAAGAEPELRKVYDARRDAFYKVLSDYSVEFTAKGRADQMLDALMDVAGHNDASAAARRLHSTYQVGFGHKSIADCGSCTLVVEGVSMLAAKAIEDWALYSGEELSTRAVDMTLQPLVDPVGTPESRAILDRWMAFYAKAQEPVAAEVRRRYPRQPHEDEKAYEGAVKMRTFDVTRGFLPAASTTNVSLHMNLRQHGDKLPWLIHHPLAEPREIGLTWQSMLCERYPNSGTFGGGAAVSGVGTDGREAERIAWVKKMVEKYTYPPPYPDPPYGPAFSVSPARPLLGHEQMLIEKDNRTYLSTFDPDGIAYLLDEHFKEDFESRPRGCVLPHFMSDLGQVRFRFDLDFGSFRDLQRHRNGVCRMPVLTMFDEQGRLGNFESWYLEQLPDDLRVEATELLATQEKAYLDLYATTVDSQYYVAMGYKVPVSITYGLPAFVYVCELRSMKVVHPTLRKKVLWMADEFQKKFPHVKLHLDREPDGWDVRRGTQTITEKKP